MSFDTAVTNTDIYKGTCQFIEKSLGCPLLYLVCRHHVAELILKAVWQTVFGKNTCPNYPILNDFAEKWTSLNHESFDPREIENDDLLNFRYSAIELYSLLKEKDFLRFQLTKVVFRFSTGISLDHFGVVIFKNKFFCSESKTANDKCNFTKLL